MKEYAVPSYKAGLARVDIIPFEYIWMAGYGGYLPERIGKPRRWTGSPGARHLIALNQRVFLSDKLSLTQTEGRLDLLHAPTGASAIRGAGSGLRSGFTLVELLVSIVIVALLVLAVGSMMASSSALIKVSGKKMDADSEARTVFDRMAEDFAAMVKRNDVDYQFNNLTNNQNNSATMFFYSEAPAIAASATTANNSSASLVGYRINSSYQLERLGKGLQWEPNTSTSTDGMADGMVHLTYSTYPVTSASTPLAGTLAGVFPSVLAANSTDSNYHVLGDDVFRFDFWFLLKPFQNTNGTYMPAVYSNYPFDTRNTQSPGHTSLTAIGLEDVQAIVVSIAILDANSRALLPSSVNWSKVAGVLPNPADPFVAPTWEATIANAGSFASAAGIPVMAAAQVRVYERTFNLITPNNQ